MSARQEGYDDGFGVARVQWRHGRPDEDALGELLVEVWTPSLSIDFPVANKPQIRVRANVEVWTRQYGEPLRRLVHGRLEQVDQARMIHVRRWARLPDRTWVKTVTLDGWEPQR